MGLIGAINCQLVVIIVMDLKEEDVRSGLIYSGKMRMTECKGSLNASEWTTIKWLFTDEIKPLISIPNSLIGGYSRVYLPNNKIH